MFFSLDIQTKQYFGIRIRSRVLPSIACLVSVGLCFLYATTRNRLPSWWENHGGGVPYVLFWILLWLTLVPKRKAILPVALFCVLFTCGLEFLQLWTGPQWFQEFRTTRIGAAWLGYGFDPHDFLPYVFGGLLGVTIGFLILRKDPNPT